MKLAAVAIVASCVACTHQKEANTLPPLKRLTVNTVDGRHIEATVAPDRNKVVFVDGNGQVIADERVISAEKLDRGRGAAEGLAAGALTGLVVGAVLGYADGDDECSDTQWCILQFSAGEKAALVGALFGAVGGVTGLVVGAAIGSRDVYTFGARQEYRVTPSGPPGSVVGATVTF